MIQTIRKKLKSEDGASLMLALLFFVICAMVASVILAAATAAAGRISKLEETDRNRLAMECAASILEEQLNGWTYQLTYTGTATHIDEVIENRWFNDANIYTDEDGNKEAHRNLLLADIIETRLKSKINDTLTKFTPQEFELSVIGYSEKQIPKVTVEVTKIEDDDFTVILKLSTGNSGEMYLTFAGDYKAPHSETINGVTTEHAEIAWRTYTAIFNDGEY